MCRPTAHIFEFLCDVGLTPVLWCHLVNDFVSQPKIARKIYKKIPILAFKVIQGHSIWRQSKASV